MTARTDYRATCTVCGSTWANPNGDWRDRVRTQIDARNHARETTHPIQWTELAETTGVYDGKPEPSIADMRDMVRAATETPEEEL